MDALLKLYNCSLLCVNEKYLKPAANGNRLAVAQVWHRGVLQSAQQLQVKKESSPESQSWESLLSAALAVYCAELQYAAANQGKNFV